MRFWGNRALSNKGERVDESLDDCRCCGDGYGRARLGRSCGPVRGENDGFRHLAEGNSPRSLFPLHEHDEANIVARQPPGFMRLHIGSSEFESRRTWRIGRRDRLHGHARIPTPNMQKAVLVYVPFIGPSQEEVTLRVQTIARDDLMMSPDTLAFGTLKKGQGGKTTTKVTFLSDPNWQITEATSTGGYVKTEVKQDSRSGAFVTYEVTAILEKDCPAGNWVSDINLKTSNPAVARLRIPVTVNVVASVAATPEVVAFGNVALGTTPEKKITLQGRARSKSSR